MSARILLLYSIETTVVFVAICWRYPGISMYQYFICILFVLFLFYVFLYGCIQQNRDIYYTTIPVVYLCRIARHDPYLPYRTRTVTVEPSVTARANNVPLPMSSSRGVGRSDWLAFLTAVSVSHAFIERRRQQSTILLLSILLLSIPIHLPSIVLLVFPI